MQFFAEMGCETPPQKLLDQLGFDRHEQFDFLKVCFKMTRNMQQVRLMRCFCHNQLTIFLREIRKSPDVEAVFRSYSSEEGKMTAKDFLRLQHNLQEV